LEGIDQGCLAHTEAVIDFGGHLAEFWMIELEMAFASVVDDGDNAEAYVRSVVTIALERRSWDLEFWDQFIRIAEQPPSFTIIRAFWNVSLNSLGVARSPLGASNDGRVRNQAAVGGKKHAKARIIPTIVTW
jgi:hypothetical protein